MCSVMKFNLSDILCGMYVLQVWLNEFFCPCSKYNSNPISAGITVKCAYLASDRRSVSVVERVSRLKGLVDTSTRMGRIPRRCRFNARTEIMGQTD